MHSPCNIGDKYHFELDFSPRGFLASYEHGKYEVGFQPKQVAKGLQRRVFGLVTYSIHY